MGTVFDRLRTIAKNRERAVRLADQMLTAGLYESQDLLALWYWTNTDSAVDPKGRLRARLSRRMSMEHAESVLTSPVRDGLPKAVVYWLRRVAAGELEPQTDERGESS
jgi:hypothetical protein